MPDTLHQGHPVTACSPATCGRDPDPAMVTLTVTINGTGTNPHARMGLRQNPFPQLGIHEFTRAEAAVHSLDGEPVRSAADIRERLAGFAPPFVEGCVARYRPGVRTRFTVTFPRARFAAVSGGAS